MHQDREREAGGREQDLERASGRPRRKAEPRAERRSEQRVVENRRPEEVAPADEEIDPGDEPFRLRPVEEEREVLGQGEPESDRGAVDEPVVEPLEDGDPESPRHAPEDENRDDERDAFRALLDQRRGDRVPEDDLDVPVEQPFDGPVPSDRDRGGTGRAPQRNEADDPKGLRLVPVEQPDGDDHDHRLHDRDRQVERRLADGGDHLVARKQPSKRASDMRAHGAAT